MKRGNGNGGGNGSGNGKKKRGRNGNGNGNGKNREHSFYRIIEKEKPTTFGEKLEALAAEVTKGIKYVTLESEVSSILLRDIALTLDHINQTRERYEKHRGMLSREVSSINSEIANLEPRAIDAVDMNRPDRSRLRDWTRSIQDRIIRLEQEEAHSLQVLHDRLENQLNRLAQVRGAG